MRTAIITLSKAGLLVAERIHCSISASGSASDVFVHESVDIGKGLSAKRFVRVFDLTAEIFNRYQGIIYIAPCGVVVRAISPHIAQKTSDPAVVVVDVGASLEPRTGRKSRIRVEEIREILLIRGCSYQQHSAW